VQRVIFLDCDGPVIPGKLYKTKREADLASVRLKFDSTAIDLLNQLCDETHSVIVTNSMQNYIDYDRHSLRDDLITAGLNSKHFHTVWRTDFPNVNYTADPSPIRGWGRWLGIKQWQQQNGEANWICFDDRIWTDDPRLIAVDFHHGITAELAAQGRAQLLTR